MKTGQQIVNGIIATVLVLGVFALMGVGYDNKAEYRSRATCTGLVLRDSAIEKIGVEQFEERISADTKTVTFVHRGALPFSRYWCTVKVKDGIVTEGKNSHHWVW